MSTFVTSKHDLVKGYECTSYRDNPPEEPEEPEVKSLLFTSAEVNSSLLFRLSSGVTFFKNVDTKQFISQKYIKNSNIRNNSVIYSVFYLNIF